MYIKAAESHRAYGEILKILPPQIRGYMLSISLKKAQELRLILGQPIIIRYNDGDFYLSKKGVLCLSPQNCAVADRDDFEYITERLSQSSLYSVKDELRCGYITMSGGHRAGITGTAVSDGDGVQFMKNISAINIRIAREVIGCSREVIGKITDNGLRNTLIISPPACGKTTVLRDIIRELSAMGYYVGVADERSELAGMHEGVAEFDIGQRAFVMEGCAKAYAMECMVRTMSPDVIATDELGRAEDVNAVYETINSGVTVIATAHGRCRSELQRRDTFKRLIPMFDVIITLSRREGVGTVENVEY